MLDVILCIELFSIRCLSLPLPLCFSELSSASVVMHFYPRARVSLSCRGCRNGRHCTDPVTPTHLTC